MTSLEQREHSESRAPREQLARYFRQLVDLGIADVFLDGMTAVDAVAAMSGATPFAVPVEALSGNPASPVAPVAESIPAGDDSPLDLAAAEAAACIACGLHQGRRSVVFGEGSATARLVVVGEAPGQEEDRTGRPFVGRAGQLLDRLLLAVGFPRDEVYICNTLKCRPPQNRNPQPDELAACGRFLRMQLDAIRPGVILAVGRFAAQALLESELSIGRLRGEVHRYRDTPLIVTYHPAFLLRSPHMTRSAWQDFQMVRKVLDEQT